MPMGVLIRGAAMVLAPLLLLLLSPGGRMAHAGFESAQIGISFPDELAGFRYRGTHDYGSPSAGVSLRYEHGDAHADIYIYTGGLTGISDGIGASATINEFRQAAEAVLRYARQQHQAIETVTRESTIRPGGPVPFLFALFRRTGTPPQESVLLLTRYHDTFVKIRITYPPARSAAVQAFAAAVADLLAK